MISLMPKSLPYLDPPRWTLLPPAAPLQALPPVRAKVTIPHDGCGAVEQEISAPVKAE